MNDLVCITADTGDPPHPEIEGLELIAPALTFGESCCFEKWEYKTAEAAIDVKPYIA